MKFSEALIELREGQKITRSDWLRNDIFFQTSGKKDGHKINCFYVASTLFRYDNDILLSDDWKIEGQKGLHTFDKAVDALEQMKKISLSSWDEKYVEKDPNSREIIVKYVDICNFTPCFKDFIAEDWMIYEKTSYF